MVKNGTAGQGPQKGHWIGEQCVPLGLHGHDHDGDDDAGDCVGQTSQTKCQPRPPTTSHQQHACFESLLRQIGDKREVGALQQLPDFP